MVIMEGMVFQPDVITVASGDTVVWVNKDMVPHSATSAAAGFDSKVIPANTSWRIHRGTEGRFRLHLLLPSDNDEGETAGPVMAHCLRRFVVLGRD